MKWREVLDVYQGGKPIPTKDVIFDLVEDGYAVKIEGGRYYVKKKKLKNETKVVLSDG